MLLSVRTIIEDRFVRRSDDDGLVLSDVVLGNIDIILR